MDIRKNRPENLAILTSACGKVCKLHLSVNLRIFIQWNLNGILQKIYPILRNTESAFYGLPGFLMVQY